MEYTITLSKQRQIRPWPKNLRPCDESTYAPCTNGITPDSRVRIIDEVQAVGRGPLRHQGKYLPECFVGRSHLDRWFQERGHWRLGLERLCQSKTRLEDTTIWITDNWSLRYFHWMCDALPRLQMASAIYPLDQLTLLLPSKSKRFRFIQDSLAPFGLGKVRVLGRWDQVTAKKMVLPAHVASTGRLNNDMMCQMRDRFHAYLQRDEGSDTSRLAKDLGPRIYISRKLATRRRIKNEAALLPVLKRHGFAVVEAESLDWETQMHIAFQANCIVSNHGAGLTNLMMMKPGSQVLEIRDEFGRTPNCYFSLAGALGIDYYYLHSYRANQSESVHKGDTVVDPDKLDDTLSVMSRGSEDEQT